MGGICNDLKRFQHGFSVVILLLSSWSPISERMNNWEAILISIWNGAIDFEVGRDVGNRDSR